MRTDHEWTRGEFLISTNSALLDLDVVHGFLTESYWAAGVSREVVQRSIENSLPFGLYNRDRQIGFARVITDYATFAYLADVFVLDEFRGDGLGKWLIGVVTTHPELAGLRRWMLATRDAHGLYEQSGFVRLSQPDRWMERQTSHVYSKPQPPGEPG